MDSMYAMFNFRKGGGGGGGGEAESTENFSALLSDLENIIQIC